MQWEDISLERREWKLPKTKNGKSHTIPLLEEVVSLLINRRTLVPKDNPYVFPGCGHTGHQTEPKRGWQRILEQANIKTRVLYK